jgi:hypothetical protein
VPAVKSWGQCRRSAQGSRMRHSLCFIVGRPFHWQLGARSFAVSHLQVGALSGRRRGSSGTAEGSPDGMAAGWPAQSSRRLTATISLKLSDGVRRPVPGVMVAVGNGCAFSLSQQGARWMLGRGLAIGVTYSICAAVGGVRVTPEPGAGDVVTGSGAVPGVRAPRLFRLRAGRWVPGTASTRRSRVRRCGRSGWIRGRRRARRRLRA